MPSRIWRRQQIPTSPSRQRAHRKCLCHHRRAPLLSTSKTRVRRDETVNEAELGAGTRSFERVPSYERTSSSLRRYVMRGLPFASLIVIALAAGYALSIGIGPRGTPSVAPEGITGIVGPGPSNPLTSTVAAVLTENALARITPLVPITITTEPPLPPPLPTASYTSTRYADCWDHPGATNVRQFGHYTLTAGRRAGALGKYDVAGFPWILVDVSPEPVWDTLVMIAAG